MADQKQGQGNTQNQGDWQKTAGSQGQGGQPGQGNPRGGDAQNPNRTTGDQDMNRSQTDRNDEQKSDRNR